MTRAERERMELWAEREPTSGPKAAGRAATAVAERGVRTSSLVGVLTEYLQGAGKHVLEDDYESYCA